QLARARVLDVDLWSALQRSDRVRLRAAPAVLSQGDRAALRGGVGPGAIIAAIVSRPNASAPPRVLTGFRPTGPLHVGHWAGNVGNAVRLQEEGYECFYFVADWHMLTAHYDRVDDLPANVEGLVLDLLAAGIDPERSVVYRQS